VLVPTILDLPIRAASAMMPFDKAFGRVYALFHFAALASLLALLAYELSIWFTLEQAVVGALLVGSTMRMALRQGEYWDLSSIPMTGVFAPHSLLEPIFVAATIVFSLRDRRAALAIVFVAAILNSEAGLFLPLVYFAVRGVSRSSVTIALGYAALCAAALVAIRIAIGPPAAPSSDDVLRENLAHVPTTLINVALFLGPLWALAVIGLKRAPEPVRRSAILIPVYLAAVAAAGVWWDVRLLMGLYPLLMPLVLAALFTPRTAALA